MSRAEIFAARRSIWNGDAQGPFRFALATGLFTFALFTHPLITLADDTTTRYTTPGIHDAAYHYTHARHVARKRHVLCAPATRNTGSDQ